MNGTIEAMARAIIDKVYPVNVIVEFSLETDPNTVIGCGTQWERFAAGRALIGRSDTYAVGWEGGEATHMLTVNEMPHHSHAVFNAVSGEVMQVGQDGPYAGGQYVGFSKSVDVLAENAYELTHAGGNHSHNNIQPSRAVDRWVRVA